ncbi:hypothetical protein AB0L63_32115 [Nocardia sp. NPDC051990]|uniref:hypothetical protein n=1 Tax=Nocardia sp. NPDC051990 TaxID=3155285 RepID=UPI00344A0085
MGMPEVTDVLSTESARMLSEFMALDMAEQVAAWRSLLPPPFAELDGEYEVQRGYIADPVARAFAEEHLFNENGPTGCWLGKCYQPLGQATGEGYNKSRIADGRIVRRGRFGTHLGRSFVDGRPSLMMTYSSFRTGTQGATDLVDEMRKLTDGVYVGIGTQRISLVQARMVREQASTRPGPRTILDEMWEDGQLPQDQPCCQNERTVATGVFVLAGPVEKAVGPDDPAAEAFTA